jgi:hypothetical protein
MNNNKKHKMRPFEIAVSIILTLLLIGLIYYGYYKQNKVLDAYEELYNKQEITEEEQGKTFEVIDMNSNIISKLFPLGQVKYGNDIILSYDLVNYIQSESDKNDLFFLGVKKQEKKQEQKNEVTNDSNNNTLNNTTNTSIITTQTITNTIQDVISSSLSSKSNYSTDILAIDPILKKDEDGNLMLQFKAVYVRDLGESKQETEKNVNIYNCYQRYNFETDMFLSRVTDNVYSNDLVNAVKLIDATVLETHTITYKYNQELDNYTYDDYKIE